MICPACGRITRNSIFEDRGYGDSHYTVSSPGLCNECEDLEVQAIEQELYEYAMAYGSTRDQS